MERVTAWVKSHATWVVGGIIGLVVAWYLIFRPQSSSDPNAPTSVSFPASSAPTDLTPTSSTPTSTPTTVSLSLTNLAQSWHIMGSTTGQPWNFSTWEQGIFQNLPTGVNPTQGVMTYIWNTIYADPTLSQGGQAAVDFVNATLNDWLLNPSKYPTTGTPVLPPAPAPLAAPYKFPTLAPTTNGNAVATAIPNTLSPWNVTGKSP